MALVPIKFVLFTPLESLVHGHGLHMSQPEQCTPRQATPTICRGLSGQSLSLVLQCEDETHVSNDD